MMHENHQDFFNLNTMDRWMIRLLYPAIVVCVIGFATFMTFGILQDDPEIKDPISNMIIPMNSTVRLYEINVTLEEGEYEIWYDEYSNPGLICIYVNEELIKENYTVDPDDDFWLKYNHTTYYRMCRFQVNENSTVTINKTGNDGFYLTPVLYKSPDMTGIRIGGIIFLISAFLFITPIVLLIISFCRTAGKIPKDANADEKKRLKEVDRMFNKEYRKLKNGKITKEEFKAILKPYKNELIALGYPIKEK